MLSVTHAEPMFFATLDKGWNSNPIRSTTASMALLTISANNTNIIESTIKTTCRRENGNRQAITTSGTKIINSC